jgi:virulence-associated protein VapD
MDEKVSKESFKAYRDWQRYIAQLLGVAAIGSVYLSRATGPAAVTGSAAVTRAAASAGAMSATACWLAALSAAGLLAAAVMTRAVRAQP